MSDVRQNFYSRVGRLNSMRANRMKNSSHYVSQDGLLVVQPERPSKRRVLRAVLYFIVALLAFKTLVLAFSGTAFYEQRIEEMRLGTAIEKTGAFLMQVDPASQFFADKLRPYVR